MKILTTSRRIFWFALAAGLLGLVGIFIATGTNTVSKPANPALRQMIPALGQLDGLAAQFDADHNQALSSQEQKAMVGLVLEKHGKLWAERLRRFLDATDTNHDGTINVTEWTNSTAEVKRLAKAGVTPPKAETFRIAMRDGVHLATDVYLPEGEGPFPVVLSRTPYGRKGQGGLAAAFAAADCILVLQDMRGRHDSEGENLPFIGCGWGEHQDGVDTIAWLRKQKWCDGNIATMGESAGGVTQNLLAGASPEGLKAQYITVAAASLYSDCYYVGGAFRKADIEAWMSDNKADLRALEIISGHPNYDDYWRMYDTTLRFAHMNVPAVHVGGWFDMFTQATIDEFVGRQHSGATGARGAQKLVMGPWTHSIGRMPAGELTFPNANGIPDQYNFGRWFLCYLLGEENGIKKEPSVAYYVMGDTGTPGAPGNQWRYADDWPIPARETAAYFVRDGKLSFEKPDGNSDAHVEYTFDPANPSPTIGGNNLTLSRGPMVQNKIENRGDVVVFTSEPLNKPIEVTGRVKAKVFIAASTADTDLSVRLCDVYPNGKSYLIAEGILRLRFRNSFEKPEPLTPGKIEEVTVDCWSTSIIFNKGHRIRATVTSSNYPRFDLNPGTGQPWSNSPSKLKQTNRIYCDAAHASRLLLPVVGTVQ